MRHIEQTLEKTARKDKNPLVRAYAELALVYLSDESIHQMIKVLPEETSVGFFQRLQQAVYDNALAMK